MQKPVRYLELELKGPDLKKHVRAKQRWEITMFMQLEKIMWPEILQVPH